MCSTCVEDPEQREAYQAIVLISRKRHALVAQYGAAWQAIRQARVYLEEGDRGSLRVGACFAEVKRCREAIRAVRHGRAPGLSKGRPPPVEVRTRRVS